MRFTRLLVLAALTTTLAGCKSTPPPPVISPKTQALQAQLDAMYVQFRKNCIDAPAHQIETTHAQCKEQNKQMDPVSQALQESEQADAAALSRSR